MTDNSMRHLEAAPFEIKTAATEWLTRVYLVTTYDDGTQWHRTGRVGRTMGITPGYLLLSRANSMGSSDVLLDDTWGNTVVAGIKHPGSRGYHLKGVPVFPGRNRFVSA